MEEFTRMMQANYHTHTVRCNHAEGTEREYIEQAIARKVRTLGFSDHSPQVFDGGYVSGFRMLPDQLEDYVTTLQNLRREYAGKIEIAIGLEAEYYPKYFDRLLDLIRPFQLDYLILGQHFTGNESDGEPACPHPGEAGCGSRQARESRDRPAAGPAPRSGSAATPFRLSAEQRRQE